MIMSQKNVAGLRAPANNLNAQYISSTIETGGMFFRVVKVLPMALLSTCALVFGMQHLISSDKLVMPELPDYKSVDIVMPPKEIETFKEIPKPELIESTPPPTLPPRAPIDTEINITQGVLAPYEPPPITGTGIASDRMPIAKVMIAPNYPKSASRRGIEGYVDLIFDVTENGATTNIRVLGAQPEKIFNRAAIRAVSRWKFSPFVDNGTEAAFAGMTRRVKFELAKN